MIVRVFLPIVIFPNGRSKSWNDRIAGRIRAFVKMDRLFLVDQP